MLIAVFTAVLVGAVLGLRFNVFVLLPTAILALLCTGMAGAMVAMSAASIFVAIFSVCAALQIGYSFSLLIWLGVLYLLPEHSHTTLKIFDHDGRAESLRS
jgi:hypothetical protein